MLAFLIEQHGLRQSGLPEIGPQSVVSVALAGKRPLNLRQVRLLCARFHVPMEALAGQARRKRRPAGADFSLILSLAGFDFDLTAGGCEG